MRDIDGYYTDVEIAIEGDTILEHVCEDMHDTFREMAEFDPDDFDAALGRMGYSKTNGVAGEELMDELAERLFLREFPTEVEYRMLGALLPRLWEDTARAAAHTMFKTEGALVGRLSALVHSYLLTQENKARDAATDAATDAVAEVA